MTQKHLLVIIGLLFLRVMSLQAQYTGQSSYTLTVDSSAATNIQWYQISQAGTTTAISSATSLTYSASASSIYYATFKLPGDTCTKTSTMSYLVCDISTVTLNGAANNPTATTFLWTYHGTPTATFTTATIQPTQYGRYTLNTNGETCTNQYPTIDIYKFTPTAPSVGGTAAYTGGTICSTANMGTITLTGQTGDILKWQTSTNGGTSWTDIANTDSKTNYTFINAANNQKYRAIINTNGQYCVDSASTVVTITTLPTACTTSTCTYTSGTFAPTINTNTSANFTTHVILINPNDGLIKYVTAAGSTSFTGVAIGDYIMYAVTYDNTVSPTPTLTVGTNISVLTGCFSVSDPFITKVCCPTIAAPTTTVAQPTCSVATGTITVTAPASGVTYSFDNGSTYQAGATSSALAAGTYQVIVKDNTNGCTSTAASVIVNAQPLPPSVPTASATTQPTCSVATGKITITAPTGTGMTYSIDGSTYTNTTGVFIGVFSGTYSVTAKSSAGCTSNSTSVTINAQPITPSVPTANVTSQPTCSVATGTITITAPTGTGMTYSINGSIYTNTTGVFTGVATGTYSVTARSSGGCTSTATSVTVNAQPATPSVPTASATSQPTCSVATGTITITAPTGAGMTYSIDGSIYTNTTGIFTGVAIGTYSVTAKNSAGCASNGTSVTINAQPSTASVPTASVTSQPTCSVATGTITVTAPTETGMTYSIDGSTYTNTTGVFTNISAGTYSVTAKNSAGCTSNGTSVTVNAQPSTPSVPTANVTSQPTCSVATGTITVTAPTGTGMTYSIDGSTYTNTTGIFTGVAIGTYSVTAKNSAGCTSSSASVTVNPQPAIPTINSIAKTDPSLLTCPSLNDGSITITATGSNLQYSKDGGTTWQISNIFTGLLAGSYTIKVKDSISTCEAVYASNPFVLVAPTCNEVCNDSVDNDGDGKIDCEDADCTPCSCTSISNITYTAPTTNPTVNHTRRYVLTDDSGVIQKTSTTPLFVNCPSGQYRVYTVWYIAATYTPPLSINSNISAVTGSNVVVSFPTLEKVCAPTVQYETRILEKNYDCFTKKLTIQVQVRAKPNTGTFLMGDANYRFDYNATQLTNPVIVSQEHFSNVAPANDVNYVAQSLNGSSEGPTVGTVSLNTVYGGGGLGAQMVDSIWQTVSCIQFTKRDTALCYAFRWHDNVENPSTGMSGIVLGSGGAYDTYDVKTGNYYGNLQQCLSTLNCCTTLSLKVILEGPYNATTGLMSTVLNDRGLLPGQTPVGQFAVPTPDGQPFRSAPWNYAGTEAVITYPATVVDWVLVSLRTDSTTATSTVFRKAGLLHSDGHISFIDSCWNMTLGQKYFVVIEHRNHLGVMSNIGFSAQISTIIDFTTGDGYIRTNPPTTGQKQVGAKWVMLTGDGRKDSQTTNYDVNFNDSQRWKTESGIFDQYRYSDFNLDADTNFFDSNLWKKNNGRYSGVPH